jgi:RNA polymerase-binding transcription factor DksA
MRQEHEQIREILNEIEWKLSRSDFATEAEERALEAALIAHNHRETRVVYSALE